jgi:RNA recognition motif-containing protein
MFKNILPLILLVIIFTAGFYFVTQSVEQTIIFTAGALTLKISDFLLGLYFSKKMTLYIGNLPYKAHEQAIRSVFEQYGQVLSLRLVKDRYTGKKKGFGFVEMPIQDAKTALKKLNESIFQDRTLVVRIAKTQEEKEEKEEKEDATL